MAPILAFLSEKGFEEARQAGYDIFEYVIRNRHKIYNPYYSALLHHWTFLPDMDTDKVKPWDRVSNRNKNLKYKVKVKRGANNWYFQEDSDGLLRSLAANAVHSGTAYGISHLYS